MVSKLESLLKKKEELNNMKAQGAISTEEYNELSLRIETKINQLKLSEVPKPQQKVEIPVPKPSSQFQSQPVVEIPKVTMHQGPVPTDFQKYELPPERYNPPQINEPTAFPKPVEPLTAPVKEPAPLYPMPTPRVNIPTPKLVTPTFEIDKETEDLITSKPLSRYKKLQLAGEDIVPSKGKKKLTPHHLRAIPILLAAGFTERQVAVVVGVSWNKIANLNKAAREQQQFEEFKKWKDSQQR